MRLVDRRLRSILILTTITLAQPRPCTGSPPQRGLPTEATATGEHLARNISIRRQAVAAAATGASVTGAMAVGSRLLGPSAMGRDRRVGGRRIGNRPGRNNAVIRKLRTDEIEIGSLKVWELEVAGQRWPSPTPPAAAG